MTAYSMPVLPDCAVCGAPVVLVVDGDGAREECVACPTSQRPIPPPVDRGAIREAVRASRARRPLSGSCLGRRHTKCKVTTCRCTCHDKPKGQPDA